MKRTVFLLFAMMFVLALAGCNKANEQPASESLVGYIVIEHNTLYLDKVELITSEDTERMSAIGLKQEDMPNGYYIYNLDTAKATYELTDQTVYTFVDSNLLFVKDKDGDRLYTTTKTKQFIQHLTESYTDSPPAQNIPFFIQLKGDKIVSVEEKFKYTL